jgi:hypothetical protein
MYIMTTLELRDHQVLTYVSRFQQLTSNHIHTLVFYESTSKHPTYTSLRRLVTRGYLTRIERLLPGGSRGGSGQHVYILSREGHRLYGSGVYRRISKERNHSLAIAECYIVALELARAGKIVVHEYLTEQGTDSHSVVNGQDLRPDLVLEYQRLASTRRVRLLIEVDMATQGQKQILGKVWRYWRASETEDEKLWPDNQYVLFVAIDEARADELKRLISKQSVDMAALFFVTSLERVGQTIGG